MCVRHQSISLMPNKQNFLTCRNNNSFRRVGTTTSHLQPSISFPFWKCFALSSPHVPPPYLVKALPPPPQSMSHVHPHLGTNEPPSSAISIDDVLAARHLIAHPQLATTRWPTLPPWNCWYTN
jgi:hypothetical protein